MTKRLCLAVIVLCVWAASASAAISFVNDGHVSVNNGSTSITVTYPTGTIANDFVVVQLFAFNTTTAAPGGWTQLGTAQATGPNNQQMMVFYQNYSSGASQVFGATLAFPTAVVRVYRGVNTSTPIDQYVIGATTTVTTPTSLTLPVDSLTNTTGQHTTWPAGTANNNEELVGMWGVSGTSISTLPAGLGNTFFNGSPDTYASASGDQLIASSGTTPSAMTATGVAGEWMGAAFTLIPAAPTLAGIQIGLR